jgi:hypothetical protein
MSGIQHNQIIKSKLDLISHNPDKKKNFFLTGCGDTDYFQSQIFHEPRKCCPSVIHTQDLKCTEIINSSYPKTTGYVYEIDSQRDTIFNSYIHIKTPKVELKKNLNERIRFSFIENLPLDIIELMSFKSDDNTIQSYDNRALNNYFQWDMNCEEKEAFNSECNSLEFLEWSENVKESFSMKFFLPFFFTRDTAMAFPIFFDRSKKYTLDFSFRNSLFDLLVLQRYENDSWVYIDKSEFKNYFDFDFEKKITPSVFGLYSQHTTEEKESIIETIRDAPNKKITYYYYDYLTNLSENSQKLGSTFTLDFVSKTNISHVFFGVSNLNSDKYNLYSNFTTSTFNKNGKSPISFITIKNDINIAELALEPDHLTGKLPFYKGFPNRRGYYAFSNTMEIPILDSSSFLNYDVQTPKLICNLVSDDENTNMFKMYLCTVIKKCITYDLSTTKLVIKIN